jgi:hypothetical protein
LKQLVLTPVKEVPPPLASSHQIDHALVAVRKSFMGSTNMGSSGLIKPPPKQIAEGSEKSLIKK